MNNARTMNALFVASQGQARAHQITTNPAYGMGLSYGAPAPTR